MTISNAEVLSIRNLAKNIFTQIQQGNTPENFEPENKGNKTFFNDKINNRVLFFERADVAENGAACAIFAVDGFDTMDVARLYLNGTNNEIDSFFGKAYQIH